MHPQIQHNVPSVTDQNFSFIGIFNDFQVIIECQPAKIENCTVSVCWYKNWPAQNNRFDQSVTLYIVVIKIIMP